MPDGKKILFLRATSGNFGGIENQIFSMAEAFGSKSAYEPALVTSDGNSLLSEKFKQRGYAVHVVPMGRLDVFRSAGKLGGLIDFNTVAIVQSHMFLESFIGRTLKRRFPHIIHAYRVHTYIDCSWIPEWRKRAYHWADKLTSNYVDIYLANGTYLKKEIVRRSGIRAGKVQVIFDCCPSLDMSLTACYPATGLLKPEIVMVANLVEHKGHDVLIKSLALLRAKGMVVRARLLGSVKTDINHVNKLKQLAAKNGVLEQLEFFGFAENVALTAKDIPVLVLPSDREGLPNCILEGMNLKKIVIVSDVGAMPEFVRNGYNGFLHPPQNPAALADILFKIFTSPAASLQPVAEAAYSTWQEKFTLKRTLSEFLSAYVGITEEKI